MRPGKAATDAGCGSAVFPGIGPMIQVAHACGPLCPSVDTDDFLEHIGHHTALQQAEMSGSRITRKCPTNSGLKTKVAESAGRCGEIG